MVLMMVRREARPCERQPKMLIGDLENNYRNTWDLVRNISIVTAKRKFNLLFLGVKEEGS
jgi:hypothetical protein